MQAFIISRVSGEFGWGALPVAEGALLSRSWKLLLGAYLETLPVFDVKYDTPVTLIKLL